MEYSIIHFTEIEEIFTKTVSLDEEYERLKKEDPRTPLTKGDIQKIVVSSLPHIYYMGTLFFDEVSFRGNICLNDDNTNKKVELIKSLCRYI